MLVKAAVGTGKKVYLTNTDVEIKLNTLREVASKVAKIPCYVQVAHFHLPEESLGNKRETVRDNVLIGICHALKIVRS